MLLFRNFEYFKEEIELAFIQITLKKTNVVLMIVGLVIILFAIFCPFIIAEVHSIAWRIVIGLLGCFSLVSGIYKTTCKLQKFSC